MSQQAIFDQEDFDQEVADIRQRYRFTQAQMAQLIKVDKQTISNWESGRTRPAPLIQYAVLSFFA